VLVFAYLGYTDQSLMYDNNSKSHCLLLPTQVTTVRAQHVVFSAFVLMLVLLLLSH